MTTGPLRSVLLAASVAVIGALAAGPGTAQGDKPAGQQAPAAGDTGGSAADFVAAPGYERLDAQGALDRLIATFDANPASAFRPGSGLGPLTQAVLLLEAEEGALPRARYRIRYGVAHRPDPPGGGGVPLHVVRIARYNLGPAMRAELLEGPAAGHVGPPEAFGVGPHVSYRLVTRPVQGYASQLVALSRAEIGAVEARADMCLAAPCLQMAALVPELADWPPPERLRPLLDPVYEGVRDGLPSPAAVTDLLTLFAGGASEGGRRIAWEGFSPPAAGTVSGSPFIEVVIETGLGQEAAIDGALRRAAPADAAWTRVNAIAGGAGPLIYFSEASEASPGD
ncbi:hypothetical protein C2I36_01610 [Rhodobacteraceae bacterium WD3A24]|nr:hypothetical protein C2I36_01610 [Rhodobacteraceae bacterium WD3A24]